MEERLKKIKAFVFDVDGVLTDGGILCDLSGELYRVFDSKDSLAIRMAVMRGYHIGVITGGRSESIRMRFHTCGLKPEDIYLGSRVKIDDLNDFCSRHGISTEEVMYFGDDLPDIPVLEECGCGVCPIDAVEDVIAVSDIISSKPGGKGCVRETMEMTMKVQGTWGLDMQEYKRHF